ncbi:MAG: type and secretion system protein [Gammaproteobacteria bacterium]|nr:type and secretion system protein [Gammaproteobacteria bacterium]
MTTFSRRLAGAVAILALIAGCAANRLHEEGLKAVARGDYEDGVAKLSEAVRSDPRNMGYRLDLAARRDEAVQRLIGIADDARAAGQFDAAALAYRRVLVIDPANDRAHRGLAMLDGDARQSATVAAARQDFERKDYDSAEAKLRVILGADPGFKPAQDLAAAITAARGPTTVAPRLKTRDNRKVTLQFRDAPTKMVFEVLSRETGINFILDKDIKSDGKTTIFVQDVAVEEAIDLVLDQSALARQVLSSNMVMVYPNNPNKQKEYEQQMVRTFYLTNAEPKEVESMLKAVLGAKTLFIDERSSAVILRDTPDAVRMAEKLVASVDVPEAEVMLEVEVLEISSSKLQDLGILYPSTATLTPTAVGTGVAASGLVLSDLSHQNSHTITVTPLSVTLNAMKQAGLTKTLASPRIRAHNKEKAKILIGSRLPVITNSVTPTAAGTPVVTGSVQYLDVGLTLEVQSTVHLDGDVGIKVSLEVSSLLKQITTASGTIAYEIGTRNANTMLRLKDGETQILAGLIQDSDTRTANTIPGLGDIPLLGRLFGTHHTDREKDEIVLSITPRIIRMQPRPASDMTEFWYGSESRTRTGPYAADSGAGSEGRRAAPVQAPPPVPNYGSPQPVNPSVPAGNVSAPLSGTSTAEPPGDTAKSMALPTSPSPQGLAATALPAPVAPVSPPPDSESSDSSGSGATDTPTRPASPTGARSALSLDGPSEAKVGDEFQVVVQLSSQEGITRLRSQLRFDASALQLTSATVGDLVPAAAGSPSVNTKGGGAQLDLVTSPQEPVQGTGSLMILHFKALAPRATNIAAMLNVLGGTGAAVGSSSAQPLKVAIQP